MVLFGGVMKVNRLIIRGEDELLLEAQDIKRDNDDIVSATSDCGISGTLRSVNSIYCRSALR